MGIKTSLSIDFTLPKTARILDFSIGLEEKLLKFPFCILADNNSALPWTLIKILSFL